MPEQAITLAGENWLDGVPALVPLAHHGRSDSSGADSCDSACSSAAGSCAAAANGCAGDGRDAPAGCPPGCWEGGRARRERLAELSAAADRLSLRQGMLPVQTAAGKGGGAVVGKHDDHVWFLRHEISPLKL